MGSGVRGALRRFVASAFCAAGGLGGLWLGMLAVPIAPRSGGELQSLADVLGIVAWRVAVGVAAGALVAAIVCAYMPGLRARRS